MYLVILQANNALFDINQKFSRYEICFNFYCFHFDACLRQESKRKYLYGRNYQKQIGFN